MRWKASLRDNVIGLIDQLAVPMPRWPRRGRRQHQSRRRRPGLGLTADKVSEATARASDLMSPRPRLLEGKSDRLVDISSSTLIQIAGIVGRFDDHSRVLGQASDLLAAAQSNLVSTLEEREDALETLAVGLVKRSEDIEGTMRQLVSVVDTAFERANSAPARFRPISRAPSSRRLPISARC